jgi:hypothetical protein
LNFNNNIDIIIHYFFNSTLSLVSRYYNFWTFELDVQIFPLSSQEIVVSGFSWMKKKGLNLRVIQGQGSAEKELRKIYFFEKSHDRHGKLDFSRILRF